MAARFRSRHTVGAVILAAGQSRRMGKPKLTLPWGSTTVIEQVVSTLLNAGITQIVVVIGGAGEAIEALLHGYPVQLVLNAEYARSEMIRSLQIGIEALGPSCQAALIALGDQPTITAEVVKKVVEAYDRTRASIVIPSYQMHRGHPWLVQRSLWPDLLALAEEQTLREFLQGHLDQISYIQVNTPGILEDLDTPEDYQRLNAGR